MKLGNWISRLQQFTIGLSQCFPLIPVLYNAYTNELADLDRNGLNRELTLADGRLIFKTSSDTHTAATAAQKQLEKVSQ